MADASDQLARGIAHSLVTLVPLQGHGIASRVIGRGGGGNVTLFAFDAGTGLSEHQAPFEALAVVLSGRLNIVVGEETIDANEGHVARLPADVPHALTALSPSRLLLIMLKNT